MRTSTYKLFAIVAPMMSCTGWTGEAPGRAAQAIVGEAAVTDDNHDAVVAVETAGGSLCTGTIVQRNAEKDRLFVLTAAHCCRSSNPPRKVLVGADYADPTVSLPVASSTPHPCYNPLSDDYDVCVLSVEDHGRLNVRPIPLADAPDDLGPGSVVTAVGFGATPASSTLRRRVSATLAEVTPLTLAADQREGRGGICFGDSGGPFLIQQGDVEVVAGVTSFGAPTSLCNVVGVAGRVTFSGVRAQFLDKVLAGKEPSLRSLLVRRDALTAGPVRDTYLDEAAPDGNFGARVDVRVGGRPEGARVGLLRFDLAGLPAGVEVLTARVGLHQESKTGPGTISVHRVTREWDERRVTWSSFGEGGFDPAPAASFSTATAVVSSTDEVWFDVTDLARGWIAGEVENDGLMLREQEKAETQLLSSEIGRGAERPWMSICFVPPGG